MRKAVRLENPKGFDRRHVVAQPGYKVNTTDLF
jgi:hypothetical protein